MMPARTAVGRLLDGVAAFLFVAIVSGLVFGFVGAVALTVTRWLVGWPA